MKLFKKLKKISYTVYAPDYIPGHSKYFTDIDTLIKAKQIARKLGIDSHIIANLEIKSKRKGSICTSFTSPYELWLKDGYFVKFNFKTKFIDGKRYYKTMTGTEHSLK